MEVVNIIYKVLNIVYKVLIVHVLPTIKIFSKKSKKGVDISFEMVHNIRVESKQRQTNNNIEAWLSLVERYIRDVEVAGSNPVASIFFAQNPRISLVLGFFFFRACIQNGIPVLQC